MFIVVFKHKIFNQSYQHGCAGLYTLLKCSLKQNQQAIIIIFFGSKKMFHCFYLYLSLRKQFSLLLRKMSQQEFKKISALDSFCMMLKNCKLIDVSSLSKSIDSIKEFQYQIFIFILFKLA